MRGPRQSAINAFGVVAAAAIVAGCANPFSNLGEINLLPRVDQIARPDWLTYTGGREHFTLRPVGPDDLVSPDGQCAMIADQGAVVEAPAELPADGAGAPRDSAESGAAPPQTPLVQGGIALQMTECDVVRRAGAPERLEFGTNERGERTVVISYIRGGRPGIYRFAGGRLYSIERAPEPPPSARPQKSRPSKKRPERV
jgi:hypothetical protein